MALRDELGPYFGEFGGRFVPESLIAALDELDAAYTDAKTDPVFQAELAELHSTYTGRPSIITEVPRFAAHAGGVRGQGFPEAPRAHAARGSPIRLGRNATRVMSSRRGSPAPCARPSMTCFPA